MMEISLDVVLLARITSLVTVGDVASTGSCVALIIKTKEKLHPQKFRFPDPLLLDNSVVSILNNIIN